MSFGGPQHVGFLGGFELLFPKVDHKFVGVCQSKGRSGPSYFRSDQCCGILQEQDVWLTHPCQSISLFRQLSLQESELIWEQM